MFDTWRGCLAACLLLVAAASCRAQMVEDMELAHDGAKAVLHVRFVAPVQYRNAAIAAAQDVITVFYEPVSPSDVTGFVSSERRLPGRGGLPELLVTDEPVNRNGPSRRLVVRSSRALKMQARAGRGDRTIDVLLEWQQAEVPAAAASQAASAPVAAAAAAAAASAPLDPPVSTPAGPELDAKAAALLAGARAAAGREDFAAAIEQVERLLDLPPNASSREAQELAGVLRLKVGDMTRARTEFELFLRLYPSGPDADRVRAELQRLPARPEARSARSATRVEPTTAITGSASAFFYGGQSRGRTQEFQDSPLSGLPELVSDSPYSSTDQKQLVGTIDFNWRHRDADSDMRFVFRDNYTEDWLPRNRDRNRLSALYFDHRSTRWGTNLRIGRQSATGGGVMGRFDGLQAGYAFAPKWRLNVVAGEPTDKLLESRRRFAGAWVEAEALAPGASGSLYVIEQRIDGQTDRRAVGTDLRYFSGAVSASGTLDYDVLLRGLNIAALQGTWQLRETTTLNVLYDRRATPLLMVGNALFFQDPSLPLVTRLRDLLGTTTMEALRQQVKSTTAYTTQALLGVTMPIASHWQLGTDVRLTNVGELLPVPGILPAGQAGTGNLWSVGAQLIGTNLYSTRDTHVGALTLLTGPTFKGLLLTYNQSTHVGEAWQLEPSLKFYAQDDASGGRVVRLTPGLRVSYRLGRQTSVESELSTEWSRSSTPATTSSPQRDESATRTYYYLGGRYDF